jgi:hypothetical protein
MIVSDSGGERFVIPQGTHYAICVGVADIGTQPSANSDFPARRKIVLTWLLPDVTHVFSEELGPEPAETSRFFTASLDERGNLRPFLEMWRGLAFSPDELKGFDTAKLLNAPVMLQVIHKGDTDKKAIINGCMKVANRGTDSQLSTWHFSFDTGEREDFNALPEWLQSLAKKSPEYAAWVLDAEPVTEEETGLVDAPAF